MAHRTISTLPFAETTAIAVLFDDELASEIASFRKFRYVFFHGYGFYMDWDRMQYGVTAVASVPEKFKSKLDEYLAGLA